MSGYEVPEPILNSPFKEPKEHWHIVEGKTPERRPGRRPAMYFYRDPKAKPETEAGRMVGTAGQPSISHRFTARPLTGASQSVNRYLTHYGYESG